MAYIETSVESETKPIYIEKTKPEPVKPVPSKGRISYFNCDRGFGIIKTVDSREAFFHITNVSADYDPVRIGDIVQFNIIPRPKPKKDKELEAIDVVLVSKLKKNRDI